MPPPPPPPPLTTGLRVLTGCKGQLESSSSFQRGRCLVLIQSQTVVSKLLFSRQVDVNMILRVCTISGAGALDSNCQHVWASSYWLNLTSQVHNVALFAQLLKSSFRARTMSGQSHSISTQSQELGTHLKPLRSSSQLITHLSKVHVRPMQSSELASCLSKATPLRLHLQSLMHVWADPDQNDSTIRACKVSGQTVTKVTQASELV